MSGPGNNLHLTYLILINGLCLLAFELRLLDYLSEFQWQLVVYVGFILNGALAWYAFFARRQLRWLGYLGASLLGVIAIIAPTPMAAVWMVARGGLD